MLFESQIPPLPVTRDGKSSTLAPSTRLVFEGPLLRVVISPTKQHIDGLIQSGLQIPDSVTGVALIDTGCTFTAVDENVCERLGLKATGLIQTAHADGSSLRPTYPVEIGFPGLLQHPLSFPKAASVRLHAGNQKVIVLLGRDFLKGVKFTYNGPRGRFEIDI